MTPGTPPAVESTTRWAIGDEQRSVAMSGDGGTTANTARDGSPGGVDADNYDVGADGPLRAAAAGDRRWLRSPGMTRQAAGAGGNPVLPAGEGNSCQRRVAGCEYSGTTRMQKILFVLVLVFFINIDGRINMTTMIQLFHTCPNESTMMLVPTRGANPNTTRQTTNSSENQSFPVLVPNLCFVHVGKSGGNSIVKGLSLLLEDGHIGGGVQIHGSTAAAGVETIWWGRDYVWDVQVGKYRHGQKQIGTFRSFEGENSGSVRHFRTYYLNNKARVECTKMGHVFTWIRDPVSRFVSVWNFQTTVMNQKEVSNYTAADLETLIGNLTKVGLPKAWEFLRKIDHVASDISFYFGEKHQNIKATEIAWEDRSKSCKAILNSMPLVFVGRSEQMLSDWDTLLKLLPPGANQVVLPHLHKTPRVGKRLSRGNIDFIRLLYASDYRCISEMVEIGLVDESYLHYILSDEREYTF